MTETSNSTGKNWTLRAALIALAVYAGVLIVVGYVLLLLPLEQRRALWWIGPALALAAVGFLWGRGGDRWSMVILCLMAPSSSAFHAVKPWPLGLLAVAGMFSALGVGYGVGAMSKRVGGTVDTRPAT